MKKKEPDKPIIDRIRKLLTLANDHGASEGEIDNAMRFARKLMKAHNVTEDYVMLEETDEQLSTKVVEDIPLYRSGGSIPMYYQWIGMAVADLTDTKLYISSRQFDQTRKGVTRKVWKRCIVYYGMEHDVAVAMALFKELYASMNIMFRFRYGDTHAPGYGDYCKGWSSRVVRRTTEMKRAQHTHEPNLDGEVCTAVILKKDAALTLYQKGLNLTAGKHRTQTITHSDKYMEGGDDGNKVQLGTGITAGKAKAKPNQLH